MPPKSSTKPTFDNIGGFSPSQKINISNGFNNTILSAPKDMPIDQMRNNAALEAKQKAIEASRPMFIQDNSFNVDKFDNRGGQVGAIGNGAAFAGEQSSGLTGLEATKENKLPSKDSSDANNPPLPKQKPIVDSRLSTSTVIDKPKMKNDDDDTSAPGTPIQIKTQPVDLVKKSPDGMASKSQPDATEIKDPETLDKNKDLKDKAADFLGKSELPALVKTSIEEAGKDETGFIFHLKRAFEGSKWQRHLTTIAGSLAALGGMKVLGGAAIATLGGVWGAGLLGAGLVAMGIYNGYKAIKQFSEVSQKEGKGMWEMLKDKEVRNGVLLGGALSGVAKSAAMFVPGLGALIGVVAATGAEIASAAYLESKLNKDQQKLLESIQNSYERRRYKYLKDKGYLSRGEDGSPEISLHTILADIKTAPTDLERKTAQKTAIAALKMLHEETKDTKYQFVEYTLDESGVKKSVSVDITKIGVNDTPDSSKDDNYKQYELTGIDIEKIIDTLNLDKLSSDISDAYSKVSTDKKKEMARNIVERFVGLEAADVERLLSEERKAYLQSLHFSTGFHASTGVINGLYTVFGGVRTTVGAIGEFRNASPVIDSQNDSEYQIQFNDSDAHVVETYTDASGHQINGIDIDADNKADIYDNTTTHTVSFGSQVGIEKALELEGIGGQLQAFETTSTGIHGTILDANGNVSYITFTDSSGHISATTLENLASHIAIADAKGQPVQAVFSNVQPNGSVDVTIGGETYHTNLGHLDNLSETVPGLVTGTSPTSLAFGPENGDSIPAMLHTVMEKAQESNPNLAKYDRLELERMLHQQGGGASANDTLIRTENHLSTPVRDTQALDWAKSPTIMGWLEQLNGGPLKTPNSSISNTSSVTTGYTATFMLPNADELTPNSSSINTGAGIAPVLALVASSTLSYFASKGKLGGINVTTTISDSSTTSASSTTTQANSTPTSEKKELLQKDILNQVLDAVKKEGFVAIGDEKYQKTATGWVLVENKSRRTDGNKERAPLTNVQVVELLNKLDDKNKHDALASILEGRFIAAKTQLTLSDGTVVEKDVKFDTKSSSPKKPIISWHVTNEGHDKTIQKSMNSTDLVDLILKAPTTNLIGTEPSVIATSTLGSAESADGKTEKEKAGFDVIAKEIIKRISTNGKELQLNGDVYKYDNASGIWVKGKENWFNRLRMKITRASSGDEVLRDSQIVEAWKKSKTLQQDLSYTLSQVDLGSTVSLIGEKFTRTAIGEAPLRKKFKSAEFEYDKVNHNWKKISGGKDLGDTFNEEEMIDLESKFASTTYRKADFVVWKSKEKAYKDDALASEIVSTLSKEATATVIETQKNTEPTESEKSKEKVKTGLGRRLLKAALVVAAVGSGIALAGTGAGWIGAAVAGVSFLTRTASERKANSYVKQQNELLLKGSLTSENQKLIDSLKKKEELAKKISSGARSALIYSSLFAGSALAWSVFGPVLKSVYIQISAQITGIGKGIIIQPTITPFNGIFNGTGSFGTPPIVPIQPLP